MKSNFLFYWSSLCLFLMCLLREAIFVTAGEKQVVSFASHLIGCFLGDKKKKKKKESGQQSRDLLILMATVLFCRSYNLDEGNKNIWIKIFWLCSGKKKVCNVAAGLAGSLFHSSGFIVFSCIVA